MKSKTDVVIVVPGDSEKEYQHLKKSRAIEPPVFVRWIATYVLEHGYSVCIVDAVASNLSPTQVAEEIRLIKPVLVVVAVYGSQPSASTQTMPAARDTCRAIKEATNVAVMITGTHPAALPQRTLREEPVDCVCDGEGLVTTVELLQAIHANASWEKVPGIWFAEPNGRINHTTSPQLVMDLDRYAMEKSWDLLNPKNYKAHDWHCNYQEERTSGYASILTTLGCPFRCAFCCIQAPFKTAEAASGLPVIKNSYRYFNPKKVVAEMKVLVERWGIRNIKIHDEMFLLNPTHVQSLCKGITEIFGDTLNIWAYARIDTIKKEATLEMLRGAGFRWLGIGIESASSTVRDGQDKGFTDDDIHANIAKVHNAGIHVGANYIFGLPDDTQESMEETLMLATELNTVYANFYCSMAYPGSLLYEMAKRMGLTLPDDVGGPGWIGYSQHGYDTQPTPTNNLSAKAILEFRDAAWKRYYERPEFKDMLTKRLKGDSSEAISYIQKLLAMPPLKRRILEVV